MKVLSLINNAVTKFLPLWIVVFAIIAYFIPKSFEPLTGWTGFMLALILFLMGLTIPPSSFRYVLKQPKLVFFGVAFKWTVTVLISVGLGFTFLSHSPDLLTGFILAGSVPSATAASLYTFMANGTVLLSITMSVVDTFISPVVTPILLETTVGHLIPIAFLPLIAKMLLIVLLPILLGLVIQLKMSRFVEILQPSVRFFSSTTLILIVLSVVSGSQPLLEDNLSLLPLLIIITMLQILVPMFLGYGMAKVMKFNEADARAILYETGLCNTALAAILAMDYISFLAAVPAVINTILNLSFGALIAIILSNKSVVKEQNSL
ncbi:bile acid transporter [Pueribacillus theae]|uniref:Bile acid transporter n=1 Tax=Pueribacillus theae TaxID=2171751 RepID=A0A2U1JJH7_9BACI|nr:bile acid:sodium symporter family protein [Pueribacillus theae]PWA05291.1 bile acid transporter [Pueribacillus theae]